MAGRVGCGPAIAIAGSTDVPLPSGQQVGAEVQPRDSLCPEQVDTLLLFAEPPSSR